MDHRVSRADISGAKPSPVSLMPAGLDGLLSAQEIADLIAFLEARRG